MVQGKSTIQNKEPGNVIRGYKATTSNPRVSEEAKENAKHKIEELQSHGETQEQAQAEARSTRYSESQRMDAANVDVAGEEEEEEPEFMPGEEQEVREEEEYDRALEEEGAE